MADGNCCDMEACIAMFAAIDKHVRAIATFSDIDKDTVYARHGEQWEALGRRKR